MYLLYKSQTSSFLVTDTYIPTNNNCPYNNGLTKIENRLHCYEL